MEGQQGFQEGILPRRLIGDDEDDDHVADDVGAGGDFHQGRSFMPSFGEHEGQLSWPAAMSVHAPDPVQFFPHHLRPPPPPPPFLGEFFARRASAAASSSSSFQFSYDSVAAGAGPSTSSDPLGISGLRIGGGFGSSSEFGCGGLQAEFSKMTAQDIMDAKALAASKSHSEAERRRRERINAHLAKLRSLLPSTTKTDKASLLAEVIQHVKELKRQTAEMEGVPLPTESDELAVDAAGVDEGGRAVVRASLCCDDRADLLPELIRALKALRMRTLRAEITTLGGRVRNVLVVAGEEEQGDDANTSPEIHHHHHHQQQQQQKQQSIAASVHEALKAVLDRSAAGDEQNASGGGGGGIKRQRTTNCLPASLLDHRSI